MKISEILPSLIIAVLLGALFFKQQKTIEHGNRLQAETTRSFETLATIVRAAEERIAGESASHQALLTARLEEIESTQSAAAIAPFEGTLAMKIICNSGEQIELTNAHLISNGKASDSLSLRADSLAFWLGVPWDRIRKVSVRKSGTDTRPMGVVTLQNGSTLEHLIHSSDIRGRSELGQIRIAIPDVREIVNVTRPEKR